MARKIVHQLIDDLDGTVLDPGSGDTVYFALDGISYEIDLTDENAATLRAAIAPYTAAGRRLAGSSSSTRRKAPRSDLDLGDVRSWARSNGYTVSDRGRVPADIVAAYRAAH